MERGGIDVAQGARVRVEVLEVVVLLSGTLALCARTGDGHIMAPERFWVGSVRSSCCVPYPSLARTSVWPELAYTAAYGEDPLACSSFT